MATLERFNHSALRRTVITFRDTMRAHAPGINRLNVYPVPDGDTGTNMARTLDAVVAELEALVRGQARFVYQVAYSVLRNHHDAEDATQETFLRVWRHQHQLADVRDLRAWLAPSE